MKIENSDSLATVGQGAIQKSSVEVFKSRWIDTAQRRGTPMADIALRKMIFASPIFCAHMVLQGPNRPPFNGQFLFGQFHLELDWILTHANRFAVMAPRGVGKSKVFVWAYPLWQAIRNVVSDGLIVASTTTNARRLLAEIRQEVETNPCLHWLLPKNFSRDWNQTLLRFSNGHILRAGSMGSNLRGLHPAYIIGDDVLSDKAKTSETLRRQTADFWFSTLDPMPIPGGTLGLVGTPMNQSDLLYRDLRHTPGYLHRSFPIIDKRGQSVWARYFPLDAIEVIRKRTPASTFSTEYMLEPVTGESSMLPRHLMLEGGQQRPDLVLGADAAHWGHLGLRYTMGVDLAFSEASDADFFALTVLGIDEAGNRYVAEMLRQRGVPYRAQYNVICEIGQKWRCERIFVEANQAQRILPDDLIRTTDLPVRPYVMTQNKHDVVSGLPGLKLLAENKKWRLPMGGGPQQHLVGRLLDELESFTYLGGKVVSVGDHDDLAISCIEPSARVTTLEHGAVFIADVKVGDRVLTHKGRFRRVSAVSRTPYRGNAVKMAARGGVPFVLTADHPVYRARSVLAAKQPDCFTRPLCPDENSWAFVRADKVKVGKMRAGDFVWLPRPHWPSIEAEVPGAEGACWPVFKSMPVDLPLARWLGVLLGRGCLGGQRYAKKACAEVVLVKVDRDRQPLLGQFVADIALRRFGVRGVWQSARPVLALANAAFAWAYWHILSDDHRCLPMTWMGWPGHLRFEIVMGWFLASGSIAGARNLRAHTTSEQWAHQAAWTLGHVGMSPRLNRAPASPRKTVTATARPSWSVALSEADTRLCMAKMGQLGKEALPAYRAPEKVRLCDGKQWREDGTAVRVSATPIEYVGDVCNLQVDEDESFVVEGVAVHNCFLANEAAKAGGFRFQPQPEPQRPFGVSGRQEIRRPSRFAPGFQPSARF